MGPSWYSPCITHQHTVPIKYPIIRIFRHNPQWPSAKHRPGGRRAARALPGCVRYVPRPIAAVIWQTGLHMQQCRLQKRCRLRIPLEMLGEGDAKQVSCRIRHAARRVGPKGAVAHGRLQAVGLAWVTHTHPRAGCRLKLLCIVSQIGVK